MEKLNEKINKWTSGITHRDTHNNTHKREKKAMQSNTEGFIQCSSSGRTGNTDQHVTLRKKLHPLSHVIVRERQTQN